MRSTARTLAVLVLIGALYAHTGPDLLWEVALAALAHLLLQVIDQAGPVISARGRGFWEWLRKQGAGRR